MIVSVENIKRVLHELTRKIGLPQYAEEPYWVGEIDIIHSLFCFKTLSNSDLSPWYNLRMKF